MAKAMILAAGQGTRVRPLTKYMPKPMIPILGKPVLEYLIEHLARYGVKEIMINVAYSHWKIESYFGNGQPLGRRDRLLVRRQARPRRDRAEPQGLGRRHAQDPGPQRLLRRDHDRAVRRRHHRPGHRRSPARARQQEGARQRRHAGSAARGGEELRRGRQRQGRPHHPVPGKAVARGSQVADGQHGHLHLRAGRHWI